MAKIIVRAEIDRLVATDEQAREFIGKIKRGKEVMAEIRRARNVRHHRLFFAILKFIVEHTEIDSIESAKSALKVATGEVDPVIDAATGKTYFVLRSINWESKDQDEFAAFFDRAVDVITLRWMPPGTVSEDVRREIIALCDGPMMAGIEDHLR